jgi:hypothetical protein
MAAIDKLSCDVLDDFGLVAVVADSPFLTVGKQQRAGSLFCGTND